MPTAPNSVRPPTHAFVYRSDWTPPPDGECYVACARQVPLDYAVIDPSEVTCQDCHEFLTDASKIKGSFQPIRLSWLVLAVDPITNHVQAVVKSRYHRVREFNLVGSDGDLVTFEFLWEDTHEVGVFRPYRGVFAKVSRVGCNYSAFAMSGDRCYPLPEPQVSIPERRTN